MAKVYVVMDDGKKNLEQCLRFGNPVVLFKTSFYPDTVDSRQPKVLKHALRILDKFNEERDHLLLVGDLALVAICMAALVMLGKTKVKMLKYDRRMRDYYEIDIDFHVTLGSL